MNVHDNSKEKKKKKSEGYLKHKKAQAEYIKQYKAAFESAKLTPKSTLNIKIEKPKEKQKPKKRPIHGSIISSPEANKELSEYLKSIKTAYSAISPTNSTQVTPHASIHHEGSIDGNLHISESVEHDHVFLIPPPLSQTPKNVLSPSASFSNLSLQDVSNNINDYEVVRELGKGAFSTVLALSDHKTGRLIACKIMPLFKSPHALRPIKQSSRTLLPIYMSEVDKMVKLQHPHIIQCYGHTTTKTNFLIFLEYASEGTLRSFFRQLPVVRRTTMLRIYLPHILEALMYIHNKSLVHRDIKPDNILIDKSGCVKVSDFGCSRMVEANVKLSMKGTPEYFAPEILNTSLYQRKYLPAVDIWALGMTLYELAVGEHYFHHMERFQVIFHVGSLKENLKVDAKKVPLDSLRDFIEQCLVFDASKRPSPATLLSHPFLETPQEVSTTSKTIDNHLSPSHVFMSSQSTMYSTESLATQDSFTSSESN